MNCPICSSAADLVFEAKHAHVAQCPQCSHLFAAGRPLGTGVQHVGDPAGSHLAYEARNARLMRRLVRDGALRRGATVLDVGAGTGHVAKALREAGARVMCIEADQVCAQHLRELGFTVYRDLDAVDQTFDLITMIEVLEHLDDPVGDLCKLSGHLNAGGTLFLTTPCGETTRGSRATNAYDTPEHVHFFTERSLRAAMHAAGLGFDFRVINEMHPRPRGARALVAIAKDALRPIRAAAFGHHHLTGYARAQQADV